jgi:hypothetical protein
VADRSDTEEAAAVAAATRALENYLYRKTYEKKSERLDAGEICDLGRALQLHEDDPALVQHFVRIYRIHNRGTADARASIAGDGSGDVNDYFLPGCARRFVEFVRRREECEHQGCSARAS